MKKKILFLSIIFVSLFMINVNAKEVQIYFYAEGGKTSTQDFKISSDYVTYKDGTNYATYKDTDTVKVLNSIKGHKFTLKKSGTYQVFGKEWYAMNDSNNKYYYFNESKSYKMATIISKLGLTKDPYPVISLFANWDEDDNTGGTNIDAPATPVNAKSIKITATKQTIKAKEKLNLKVTYNPTNSKKETITWTSSDKKIATVSTSGVVTGIKEGTVTITAKSSRGLTSSIKIKVEKASKINYVRIRYSLNGGSLNSSHGKNISAKNDYIYNNGKIDVNSFSYGNYLPSSGLANYNNKGFINITKKGYYVPSGAEWNTKKDGSGKSYSQTKVYKDSDLCDASKKDCTVTLYANWKKEQTVTINLATFNIGFFNCGSSSKKCSPSKSNFTNLIKNNKIDVIGLQEARTKDYFKSSANKEKSNKTIREIGSGAGLNNSYIIAPSNVNAILSKYKFSSKNYISLSSCKSDGKTVEARAVEKVVLRINGVDISYYNTHLDYHPNCATQHMKDLANIVKSDPNPTIITADFNYVSPNNYNKYLKPLGFKVAAHDTKLYGKENNNSYMDSVFIKSNGHIDISSSKTIVAYSKYSDHNLVIAKLIIKK